MTTFLKIGPYGPGCDESSPFPDGQPHIALSGDGVMHNRTSLAEIRQNLHGDTF